MRAVERFDHRRGSRFSTYTTWWIRQAIRRGVANNGRLVRLPVHTGESLARGASRTARAPAASVRWVSGVAGRAGGDAVASGVRPASLSEPAGNGPGELGSTVADATALPTADAAIGALLPGEVRRLLAALDGRDRRVLALRFGLDGDEPWGLDAVARALGLSRESVRQSQARALRALRRAARAAPEIRELLTA